MDLLDRNIVEFYDDRPALDRLLRVLSQETGTPYIKMERQLQAAKESVLVGPAVGLKPTLRTVLGGVPGADPETVAGTVRVLERRDEAAAMLLEQELRELDDHQIGGPGIKVERIGGRSYDLAADAARLSSTAPMSADGVQIVPTGTRVTGVPLAPDKAARVLANAEVQEERLARARRAQPGAWDGDAGRTAFLKLDRETAEAGYDHVARLEREGATAHAQARAAAAAQRLDVAISEGSTPTQRMRLLDAAIGELGLDSTLTSVALTNKPALTSLPPIELDGPTKGMPGQGMHERILKILDDRGLTMSGYVDVMNELLDEEFPGREKWSPTGNVPPTEPQEPTVLEGVYMPNHELHQQVLARLASKGLGIGSYQRELEAMNAEANGAIGGAPSEYRR